MALSAALDQPNLAFLKVILFMKATFQVPFLGSAHAAQLPGLPPGLHNATAIEKLQQDMPQQIPSWR